MIAFPCDEEYINNIHHERKSESDHLPPAPVLTEMINSWGFDAQTIAYTGDMYIISIAQR